MKQYIKLSLLFSLILFVIYFTSCRKDDELKPFYEINNETISEYLHAKKDTFSYFQQLIQVGELESSLSAYNPLGSGYTLFLPTNEAFDRFILENENYSSFEELLADKDYVRALVRYHVANISLNTNDFPFGALPDTTLSGDLLTIGISGDLDSLVQVVNNYSFIINPNIFLTNGYIHVISEVLRPIIYNSYEWLENAGDYTIFVQALELTELRDTFNLINRDEQLARIYNTILVESDEVYLNSGIYNIDDLISRYSSGNSDFTNSSNGLYQFVAYHILEGKNFLNQFEGISTNFNTYGNLPVAINGLGVDLKINSGKEVFDTLFVGTDTTLIDYISIKYDMSNVLTINGAIHFIDHVMEIYKPKPSVRAFQFFEEPLINTAEQSPNTYIFKDPDVFEVIKWTGVDGIQYIKSPSDLVGVSNNDYLEIWGDFTLEYEIPKILPGDYMFRFKANAAYSRNAFIQIFIDGKRVGGNIDLTTNSSSDAFYTFNVGLVNFINYEKHKIRIQTLIPGRLQWDVVYFQPITN